jgi:hypothetical protein
MRFPFAKNWYRHVDSSHSCRKSDLLALALLCATTLLLAAPSAHADVPLTGTVRDLESCPPVKAPNCNPDFPSSSTGIVIGIVGGTLGADGTPVYAGGTSGIGGTTGEYDFNQWYHTLSDFNIAVPLSITLTDDGSGNLSYSNSNFFPIDTQGWAAPSFGPNPQLNSDGHNVYFTFQLHSSFIYHADSGQTFQA